MASVAKYVDVFSKVALPLSFDKYLIAKCFAKV